MGRAGLAARPAAGTAEAREAYATVADADAPRTNPGAALGELIRAYAPCLILIDEWVAYARQLYGRDDLAGGTFDTQFTFAQTLTEAVKAVPGAMLVVSIPASSESRRPRSGSAARPTSRSAGANGRGGAGAAAAGRSGGPRTSGGRASP